MSLGACDTAAKHLSITGLATPENTSFCDIRQHSMTRTELTSDQEQG